MRTDCSPMRTGCTPVWKQAGVSEALLVASLRHPTAVPLPGGGTLQEHPDLCVRLRADTIGPRLEMSERLKLKFKVSPVDPPSHPAYTRCLTMRNPACKNVESAALAVP